MRIIFMGTSEFGLPTLQKILLQKNHEIIAIFTKEPAISGRGNKLNFSTIHQFANLHNLQVFTPKTLRDKQIQQKFQELKPDIAIVVSYGLILPQEILYIPKYGCFNIHPSQLPLYRGCAPLQRSIMDGVSKSAVCIIKMDSGIDSGDIVFKRDFDILRSDNYLTISKKSGEIGGDLILKTLDNINSLEFQKQQNELATYAPKIEKTESLINWNLSGEEIFNKVRALNGNIFANFIYKNEKFKLLECDFVKKDFSFEERNLPDGTVFSESFEIKCCNGIIIPKILQKQGKNPLKIKDFLNGFKPEVGSLVT